MNKTYKLFGATVFLMLMVSITSVSAASSYVCVEDGDVYVWTETIESDSSVGDYYSYSETNVITVNVITVMNDSAGVTEILVDWAMNDDTLLSDMFLVFENISRYNLNYLPMNTPSPYHCLLIVNCEIDELINSYESYSMNMKYNSKGVLTEGTLTFDMGSIISTTRWVLVVETSEEELDKLGIPGYSLAIIGLLSVGCIAILMKKRH